MKYPQLVSTRAVNAISDWLVSRLEQLGVEAPLIYSRLLLSLLQSSVQINDPIEFNNLETFLANRKGNSKRYPPCDTDTLRKITAVQCLMEIVSSEQEITKIENLVDELCEKVNDIEKQSTNLEEDDDLQIAASALNSVLTTTTTPSSSYNRANEALSTEIKIKATVEGEGNSTAKFAELSALSVSRKSKEQQTASDAEDPRKRYYRAFPALSKEMEDSIVLLRRNTKSSTWPVDRKINLSNKNASNSTAVVIKSASASEKPIVTAAATGGTGGPSAVLGNSQRGDSTTVLCNTAGVKRKTKRRRNQAMSKGKTTAGNNTRKNSYCGGSSSPTWDTDFEGSWEMGRDLIKEFIVKQNNRNRSTSESAAYNMASGCGGNSAVECGESSNKTNEKRMKPMMNEAADTKPEPMATEQEQQQKQDDDQMAKLPAIACAVEIAFNSDDIVENSNTEDTLASVSEITEGSLSTARRLYERDISNDSLNEQSLHDSHPHQESSSSEHLDFAQFKAKFNSSVEALWKNTNNSCASTTNQSGLQSSIVSDSAVPAAPYRSEDLKNFWTNYYSHHYDVDKFNPLTCSDSCDYSMTAAGNATSSDGGHSDYFSMPTATSSSGGGAASGTTGGPDDFDKSVGGKRAGGKCSPVGVFLQNTIWSENSNASYPDTDESFFRKVLNSTSSTQKSQDHLKMDISGGDKSYYYPYQKSKWSEGINGGPHGSNSFQQPSHHQQPLVITSSSSSSSISTMDHSTRSGFANDFVDSAPTSSTSSSYLGGNPNWQVPAGNNLQADVNSWNSSNPTSLTELYGGGSAATSLGKKNSCNFDRTATAAVAPVATTTNDSSITLANHCTASSGFVAYSRIKSYAKLLDSKPIVKWQKPESDYHHLTANTAADDENLLTSERTHFHPIKMSYADGHTFEISSNLDTVDFERSDSGYLYLESEKYLEYTRSDVLAEEDGSVSGHYHGTSSVSRCSASSVASTKSSQSEFVIRFRLRTTDKSCQTEPNVVIPRMLHSSLVYQLASAHLPRSPMQSGHHGANDDDENDWMDIGCSGGILKDDDESVSMDQWSMAEIGKKCVDNNNSSHTLWGMCPACNNDMKSIPANGMLKAELSMEGDEIMSDLRYMQDLYIGSDWEDQNGTREDVGGDADGDDTDLDAETIRDCEFFQSNATPAGCGELDEDPQQKDILYNVNKLIADLLRPENAQSLANALGAVGVGCVAGVGCFGGGAGAGGGFKKFGSDRDAAACAMECAEDKAKDEKYIGGLWNSDENIIWKKEFNPIDIFSRLNNNNNDSFLEKLNWEYSNLAEIWGKASPEKSDLSTAKDSPAKADEREGLASATNEALEEEENMKIACKNMKNLLKSSAAITPALFEMNERRLNDSKRMQCFLNSNKVKISNRFDRKRRHSASQNICSNNNNNNTITFNNNNNNIVFDNNNFKLSLFGSAPNSIPRTTITTSTTDPTTTTTMTTRTKATNKETLSDYGRNTLLQGNDDEDERRRQQDDEYTQLHYNDDQPSNNNNNSQATIITCKYWTTMRPIEGDLTDDQSIEAQAAAASFFIDKNSQFIDGLPSIALNTSSILKHVTLVSRPLTR